MKKTNLVVCSLLLIIVGCESLKPTSPARIASLTVTIPPSKELQASVLGSPNNEVLYRVDGPGMAPLKGSFGPFAAPASFGSIDFSIQVPVGPSRILSLQLNDSSTSQPLAIGAVDLTSAFSGTNDVVVEMGSVIRNCYKVNTTSYFGCTLGINTNTFFNSSPTYGSVYDFAVGAPGPTCQIVDAEGNTGPYNASTVAYLGNGNYVDFDKIPPDAAFHSQSGASKLAAGAAVSAVEAGDIYCVKLLTIPNGHAWVQVKAVGTPAISGPTFNFRANAGGVSYFGYYRTAPDLAGPCPAQ